MATRIFSRLLSVPFFNQQLNVTSPGFQPLRFKGHSKWQNIKETKNARDKEFGVLCHRYVLMIGITVRENNFEADPARNRPLSKLINEAKSMGVPNATIERAIANCKTSTDTTGIFEVRAMSRIAMIVEVLGSNKGHMYTTLATILNKKGGLVEPGLLKMFSKKGVIGVAKKEASFDKAEEHAIEFGAEEVEEEEEHFVFITAPDLFPDILKQIKEHDYEVVFSEVQYIPNVYMEPANKRDKGLFLLLLKALEEHPNILSVYHNAILK